MVCVGQLHSQHPSLHCLGVINTAELILKSPVVRIFPVLSDPREECYDIYNYISTPLFILAIQTTGGRQGDWEEILPEIIFISILWPGLELVT